VLRTQEPQEVVSDPGQIDDFQAVVRSGLDLSWMKQAFTGPGMLDALLKGGHRGSDEDRRGSGSQARRVAIEHLEQISTIAATEIGKHQRANLAAARSSGDQRAEAKCQAEMGAYMAGLVSAYAATDEDQNEGHLDSFVAAVHSAGWSDHPARATVSFCLSPRCLVRKI
jgi:hypothetical protein